MDALTKLSREMQIVLGGAVLYVIFSFFDWQQVSGFGVTYGRSEWTGIGVIAALLGIALLAYELTRAFEVKVPMGDTITPGHASAGLALALLIFTVLTFLTHGTARHWPAWIGLLLSIIIAVAAFKRAKDEGVTIPELPKSTSAASGGGAAASTPAPPPAAPAPAAPAPADDAPPPAEPPAGA